MIKLKKYQKREKPELFALGKDSGMTVKPIFALISKAIKKMTVIPDVFFLLYSRLK